LLEFKEKYEEALWEFGPEGRAAWNLWSLLDGQRMGLGEGDISFASIDFIFRLYGFDRETQRDLFERIMIIERYVSERRRREREKEREKWQRSRN
jgi:hypothetical protein